MSLSTDIGIMQGRLLPRIQNRIQAYPGNGWDLEFNYAKQIGFHCIEWIVDNTNTENALLKSDETRKQILDKISETNIKVDTICADNFMDEPIYEKNWNQNFQSELNKLFMATKTIGAQILELPFVDNSSLNTIEKVAKAKNILTRMAGFAHEFGIDLLIESDLPSKELFNFITQLEAENVYLNYDIGNSASLGYNPIEELETYGHLVRNVHVKDRKLRGSTVPLGQGNANIDLVFQLLFKFRYKGHFILQTARDSDNLRVGKLYFDYVKNIINTTNS